MSRWPNSRLARLVFVLAILGPYGCQYAPTQPAEAALAASRDDARPGGDPTSVNDDQLKALRKATAAFKDFDDAVRAGYATAITPCMVDPALGGMGFHYGNTALIDDAVQPLKPEVLLYEPRRNGEMRFVGVEFIVPFTAWTKDRPPVAYGQTFRANQTFQVWALHVWTERANPDGLFADWNRRVDCDGEQPKREDHGH